MPVMASGAEVEVMRSGRRAFTVPPPDPRWAGPAGRWLAGTGPVVLRAELQCRGGGAGGTLSVWIDPARRPEPVNRAEVPGRAGRAGLAWSGVEIRVRGLALQGTVDRPEAVRTIRRRLPPEGKADAAGDGPLLPHW